MCVPFQTMLDYALTSSGVKLVITALIGNVVAIKRRIQTTTTRRYLNNMSTQLPDRSLVRSPRRATACSHLVVYCQFLVELNAYL